MLAEIGKLARLDKPGGFYLLFIPCSWSLAYSGALVEYWAIFFFGALLARSAGCIYNDMMDRKTDRLVARTKNRPLPAGLVSMKTAGLSALTLGGGAFALLLLLPAFQVFIALLSLPLVLLYPFMKRLIWAPQLWLGITFNWGVFVAGGFNLFTFLMYLGGVFWTLAYDTLYGFQDLRDDEKIGVKSLSRAIGYPKGIVYVRRFRILAMICWFAAGAFFLPNPLFYYGFCMVGAFFSYFQDRRLNLQNPAQCAQRFRREPILGAIITAGILASSF